MSSCSHPPDSLEFVGRRKALLVWCCRVCGLEIQVPHRVPWKIRVTVAHPQESRP